MLPSDNEWGVPVLDPRLQPSAVTPPVLPWGSRRRGATNTGTWSMYVDDYRFGLARTEPSVVWQTECAAVTELNITVREHTPRAMALAATYEKRWLARRWQQLGVPVFVDLCFPVALRDLCMLGVPEGWRAFSTRGYAARPHEVADEYLFAEQWAGCMPLVLVVGGGETVRQVCAALPGAVWFAGHQPETKKHGQGVRRVRAK